MAAPPRILNSSVGEPGLASASRVVESNGEDPEADILFLGVVTDAKKKELVLLVTPLRIYMLKGKQKKLSVKEVHAMAALTHCSPRSDYTSVEFTFDNLSGRSDAVSSLVVAAFEDVTADIVQAIRYAADSIFIAAPPESQPVFDIGSAIANAPARLPVPDEPHGRLRRTLEAYSVLFGSPLEETLLDYILANYAAQPGWFRLTGWGDLPTTPLRALFYALAMSPTFETVAIAGTFRKDLPTGIASAMRHNTTLTRLVLSDSGSQVGWETLGTVLAEGNPSLTAVDLSSNPISNKPFPTLAAGLGNCPLVTLDISGCEIGSKGTKDLIEALRDGRGAATLRALDLSGNKVGESRGGSAAVAELLAAARNLSTLLLAGSQVDVVEILEAAAASPALLVLDISENELKDKKVDAAADALAHSSIADLDLSLFRISTQGLMAMITAFTRSPSPCKMLHANGIDLGSKGGRALRETLEQTPNNLWTLSLNDCGLKADGCIDLLSVASNSPTLTHLALSNNIRAKDKNLSTAMAMIAAQLQNEASPITMFELGGDAKFTLGKQFPQIVAAAAEAPSLVQLDLSGHVKLDYDASTDAVINLINTSTSLKFVDIDGNGWPFDRIKLIMEALEASPSGLRVVYPKEELERIEKYSKKRQKAEVDATLAFFRERDAMAVATGEALTVASSGGGGGGGAGVSGDAAGPSGVDVADDGDDEANNGDEASTAGLAESDFVKPVVRRRSALKINRMGLTADLIGSMMVQRMDLSSYDFLASTTPGVALPEIQVSAPRTITAPVAPPPPVVVESPPVDDGKVSAPTSAPTSGTTTPAGSRPGSAAGSPKAGEQQAAGGSGGGGGFPPPPTQLPPPVDVLPPPLDGDLPPPLPTLPPPSGGDVDVPDLPPPLPTSLPPTVTVDGEGGGGTAPPPPPFNASEIAGPSFDPATITPPDGEPVRA